MKKAYLDLIERKREFIKAAENEIDTLTGEINALITGDSIKERYNARKAAKDEIDTLNTKICKAATAKEAAELVIKMCVEMYAKTTANNFIDAVKAGTKNLIDTPNHYKKFKDAAKAAIDEKDTCLICNYYTVKISFAYYSIIGNYDITALYTSDTTKISAGDAEKAKKYELITPAEIEKIASEYFLDKVKAENIKKEAAAEIEKIAAKYNNFYCINIER